MGGLGYTMTFFHISHDDLNAPPEQYSRIGQVDETTAAGEMLSSEMLARRKAIKEFRMAAAGAADSLGELRIRLSIRFQPLILRIFLFPRNRTGHTHSHARGSVAV